MGGEGIVLKDPSSLYRPGERSSAWLKLKPKLTLDVVVTGGAANRIAWGDWGEAVMLEISYVHPRSGEIVHIRQAVRVARGQPFELTIDARAELVCWGVMPSGMLRHPLFLRWLNSSRESHITSSQGMRTSETSKTLARDSARALVGEDELILLDQLIHLIQRCPDAAPNRPRPLTSVS